MKQVPDKRQSSPRLRRWLVAGITAYLSLFPVLYFVGRRSPAPIVTPEAGLELSDRPTLGPKDAPVRIVVFEDFQCPHCRDFHREVLPKLEQAFIDTGVVRLTFVHYPFLNQRSWHAALAAECAYRQGNEAFWAFAAAAFESHPQPVGHDALRPYVNLVHGIPDLDREVWTVCLREGHGEAAVLRDKALADRLGVPGTPTVLVAGQQVPGDFSKIYKAVRRLLASRRGSER